MRAEIDVEKMLTGYYEAALKNEQARRDVSRTSRPRNTGLWSSIALSAASIALIATISLLGGEWNPSYDGMAHVVEELYERVGQSGMLKPFSHLLEVLNEG